MGVGRDPAEVSEETLQSFEGDLPDPEEQVPSTPPLRRQGAVILAGIGALIAIGFATALSWFL
jgi:hypothetical protein